jgi:membrane protease YdiL (CAAX protease family)
MRFNKNIFVWSLITVTFFVFTSGSLEEPINPGEIPVLETKAVTDITDTTASGGGKVLSDGGTPITARGIVWSTTAQPTIADNKTTDGTGTGSYTSHLTGLTSHTTYYVRAYATNRAGTAYGNKISFTTNDAAQIITVKDADGNTYKAVAIGSQVWIAENLKTTRYNDGSGIPLVTDNAGWKNLTMYQPLTIDFARESGNLKAFLPIILAILFFSVYWFTAQSEKIKQRFYQKYDFDTASTRHIFFTKYFGFITMGLFPLLISLLVIKGSTFADYGLTIIPDTVFFSAVWIAGLILLIVPFAYFNARNPGNLAKYPQIRAREWTRKTVIINTAGWMLYLFGYEVLFRGVLLFPVAESLGVWPAIAINIAIYTAVHIPNGLNETVGAAPLGLIFCLLTLLSGTIWIAVVVHMAMALTNSFSSMKFHPDMHYTGSRNPRKT